MNHQKAAVVEAIGMMRRIEELEREKADLLGLLGEASRKGLGLEERIEKIEAEAMGALGGARNPRSALLTIVMLSRRGSGRESCEATQAQKRPPNFAELTAQEQWEIDKRLGILDWDRQMTTEED